MLTYYIKFMSLLGPDFKCHYFPGWVGGGWVGGWVGGWLGGGNENKANSAQLKLELGLSLATMKTMAPRY